MAGSRVILIAVSLLLGAYLSSPGDSVAASTAAPPLPSGVGRIYFFRDYEPYESLSRPYIYLNGAVAAISEPGGFTYRDVPPGTYNIKVDTQGTYPNQFKDVVLRPGDVQYVKIQSASTWWGSGGGRRGNAQRDTFVVALIPEAQGQSEMQEKRFYPP